MFGANTAEQRVHLRFIFVCYSELSPTGSELSYCYLDTAATPKVVSQLSEQVSSEAQDTPYAHFRRVLNRAIDGEPPHAERDPYGLWM